MWQRLAFVAVLLAAAHARLALYAGHGGAGTFGFGGILRFNNTAWTPVNMAGTTATWASCTRLRRAAPAASTLAAL